MDFPARDRRGSAGGLSLHQNTEAGRILHTCTPAIARWRTRVRTHGRTVTLPTHCLSSTQTERTRGKGVPPRYVCLAQHCV